MGVFKGGKDKALRGGNEKGMESKSSPNLEVQNSSKTSKLRVLEGF